MAAINVAVLLAHACAVAVALAWAMLRALAVALALLVAMVLLTDVTTTTLPRISSRAIVMKSKARCFSGLFLLPVA